MVWRIIAVIFSVLASIGAALGPARAGPVLLYDTDGDRVLYAEGADQPWYAASLTKMMTAYLVFEAWRDGRASKDRMITISAKANSQAKMRLGLGAGKELSYDHAIKALIIVSANDIAYALAEAIGGTEEEFVAQMNAKAEKLGMTGTRFINPHGLPGEGQYTTAQDMARLAAALLRDFPEHMEYFGLAMTEIGDKRKRVIATHNPVLVTFDGGDGFKTGFTCSAGYNIVASASRDGRRLIAVVLGEESPGKRAAKANALLEYGFKRSAWKALFSNATIYSMPSEFYDRDKVRLANLDQRWKDCQDPVPTPELIAKIAKKNPKLAKEMQAKLDAAIAAGTGDGDDDSDRGGVVTATATPPSPPQAATPTASAPPPARTFVKATATAAPAPAASQKRPVAAPASAAKPAVPVVAAVPAPTTPPPSPSVTKPATEANEAAKPATLAPATAASTSAATDAVTPAAKAASKPAKKRKPDPNQESSGGPSFSFASP